MIRRAALVGLALLWASSASAYVIIVDNLGDPFAWKKNTVSWYVAANGSDDIPIDEAVGAIQKAFDSWEDVGCSTLEFAFGGKVSANPNSDIFIRWLEQNWDLTVQDALGVTTNWQLNPSGGAKKVEIFFNGVSYVWATSGADDPFSNVNDVQAVAAHEIGHAIGITHTRHRQATMWFTTYPGESEEARSLEADDKNAACFLYPAVSFESGQACDACWDHTNCAVGSCIDYGDEGPHCGQDCSSNSDCPDDYGCFDLGGGTPQCIPDNEHCKNIGSNIPLGSFCYDHSTCASGYCLPLPESAACSTQCNPSAAGSGGCPSGMGCVGQGVQGICYPKGDVPIGEECVAPSDCQTILCVGIGQNTGVCTQECTTDAQCPGTMSCIGTLCIQAGTGKFGDDCVTSLDCASFYCPAFLEYCSDRCESDADCPAGIECELGFGGGSGYCDAGATGQDGDICGPGAKECVQGLVCLYSTAAATLGTCREKCDARYDDCSGSKLCKWTWQDWSKKVVGVCVADNGGVGLGESCGGALVCKPDLVCADTDGLGPKCRQDCNANNTLGCSGGAACIALNLEDNPKLGACHPKDGAPAVEDPQVVETDPTVAEPPPVDDDLGGTGAATEGGTDDQTGGTDGIDPQSTGGGADSGGGSTGTRRDSGGCSLGRSAPVGPAGPVGLWIIGLLLLALRFSTLVDRQNLQ